MEPTPVLKPLGFLYGFGMQWRNRLYDSGIFRTHRLAVPVISVGNITAGGTGKSPFTMQLARFLLEKQIKPAILSRGYGRHSRGYVLVHNGEIELVDAATGGDEPLMMARRLQQVPVAVCENRVYGGQRLIEDAQPDVILLDDGFQHRRLHRDVDIVLMDASRNPFTDACLPGGYLREPIGALQRADLVVITKGTEEQKSRLEENVHQFPVKIERIQSITYKVVDALTGIPSDNNTVPDTSCLLVTGVARPRQVEKACQNVGIKLKAVRHYADHHTFTLQDVHQWLKLSAELNCHTLITTEKDWVKLAPFKQELQSHGLTPLLLKQEYVFTNRLQDTLTQLLTDKCGNDKVRV